MTIPDLDDPIVAQINAVIYGQTAIPTARAELAKLIANATPGELGLLRHRLDLACGTDAAPLWAEAEQSAHLYRW